MKKIICSMALAIAVAIPGARAQWVVTDPGNLAQGIVNSIQQLSEASTTTSNVIKNFKEVKKIYEQGKEYYEALKQVNNLIKDARKVQQTVLMVGEISDMYVTNFEKMLVDPSFTPEELTAIAFGYSQLIKESTSLLKDLKQIISNNSMQMSDKDRLDIIDVVYKEIREYYNLVRYYTNKNISVSYLRAMKHNNAQRVLQLYGTPNQRYW